MLNATLMNWNHLLLKLEMHHDLQNRLWQKKLQNLKYSTLLCFAYNPTTDMLIVYTNHIIIQYFQIFWASLDKRQSVIK